MKFHIDWGGDLNKGMENHGWRERNESMKYSLISRRVLKATVRSHIDWGGDRNKGMETMVGEENETRVWNTLSLADVF